MSKKLLQGKIKWINFNPTDQKDDYGNSIRRDFVLESGEKISFPKGKVEEISVSEGKGKPRYVLKVGDTVAVAAEENGKYLNAKLADITVLEKGGGSGTTPAGNTSRPAQGRTGGSSGTSNSSGPDWAKKDAGIEAGHAINNAVSILNFRNKGKFEVPELISLARDIHGATRILQQEILDGGKKAPEPETTEEPGGDFEDDDLPFG